MKKNSKNGDIQTLKKYLAKGLPYRFDLMEAFNLEHPDTLNQWIRRGYVPPSKRNQVIDFIKARI